MPWEQLNQQHNKSDEIGAWLSQILQCPIRPLEAHYDKPIFECKHEITFPYFMVIPAYEKRNAINIIEKHINEIKERGLQ